MKSLHIAVLVGALAAAGCATPGVPTALPAVTHATSPAPGIVSAGRLVPADVDEVRTAGIRQVIDLTPDAETPDFDEAAAVQAAGLEYANLPLAGPSDLTRENVLAFDQLLRDAERPVLVHCGSGNRVGAMAALRAAWVEGQSPDDAIATGKAWGLTSLEDAVRERLEAGPGATGH